jgi:anti-sigma B factor antagonist
VRATARIIAGDGYNLAVLDGELDLAVTEQLRPQLVDLLNADPVPLIIDLSAVTFCDSWGLSTIVAAWDRAKEHDIGFGLVAAHPRVLLVMKLTGTDQFLPIYRELPDAIAALTP